MITFCFGVWVDLMFMTCLVGFFGLLFIISIVSFGELNSGDRFFYSMGFGFELELCVVLW